MQNLAQSCCWLMVLPPWFWTKELKAGIPQHRINTKNWNRETCATLPALNKSTLQTSASSQRAQVITCFLRWCVKLLCCALRLSLAESTQSRSSYSSVRRIRNGRHTVYARSMYSFLQKWDRTRTIEASKKRCGVTPSTCSVLLPSIPRGGREPCWHATRSRKANPSPYIRVARLLE